MRRKKKVTQKDLIEGLRRLAFGDIQDSIKLLFDNQETIINTLPELDLFNISEIKCGKGGGMEIKFFDRIKAIEKLRDYVCKDKGQTAVSFYEALEQSAGKYGDDCGDDSCD